jgi:hypothetical protein
MMTNNEDQRFKSPTKIGDKLKFKSNILGQDFNKNRSQLHNGKFHNYLGLLNLCNIIKIKKVFTKDIHFNL